MGFPLKRLWQGLVLKKYHGILGILAVPVVFLFFRWRNIPGKPAVKDHSVEVDKPDQISKSYQTNTNEDIGQPEQTSEDNSNVTERNSENLHRPQTSEGSQTTAIGDSNQSDQVSEDNQITERDSEDLYEPEITSEGNQTTASEDSNKADQISDDHITVSEDSKESAKTTTSDQTSFVRHVVVYGDQTIVFGDQYQTNIHGDQINVNSLTIEGIQVDVKESIEELEKRVSELLKLGKYVSFESVFQMPPDPKKPDCAPVIMVELSNYKDKEQIMRAAENMSESSANGREEDAYKSTVARQDERTDDLLPDAENMSESSGYVQKRDAHTFTVARQDELTDDLLPDVGNKSESLGYVQKEDAYKSTVARQDELTDDLLPDAENMSESSGYVQKRDAHKSTVARQDEMTDDLLPDAENKSESSGYNVQKTNVHMSRVLSRSELHILKAKIGTDNWVLKKMFGQKAWWPRTGRNLQFGWDIAICPNGNIAVTDCDASQVKIYNSNGQYKQSLDTTQGNKPGVISRPWGIAVSANGCYYVTDICYVKVFDAQCQYQSQFPAISPNNKPSDKEDTLMRGIDIDGNGHILVGECKNKYISKHEQDGRHIGSIKVNIAPYFLSVCPNGNIVVTTLLSYTGVQVIDSNGQLLHTLNAPPCVSGWDPAGVCCYEDVIFIANYYSSEGIYCFSITGEYLGCVTNEVSRPRGLAITADGNKLLVLCNYGTCVKNFQMKKH